MRHIPFYQDPRNDVVKRPRCCPNCVLWTIQLKTPHNKDIVQCLKYTDLCPMEILQLLKPVFTEATINQMCTLESEILIGLHTSTW